jgi:hypothetical protein
MPSNTTIRNITRTASLLGLVLTGLFVVFLMFLWPLFIHPPISIGAWIILLRVPLLAAHISLLIFCDPYLYIHRKALYPIRYLVMPLVIEIAKSEAIKEDTATWYVPTNDLPATDRKSYSNHFQNASEGRLNESSKTMTGEGSEHPRSIAIICPFTEMCRC